MNLVIDIGNTRVKTAVFQDDIILFNESYFHENFKERITNSIEKYAVKHTIVSSVGYLNENYFRFLNNFVDLLVLTHKTKVPFINNYKTPFSLGVDRIALVAACVFQYPNKNVLVFDVGSCITYDFVNHKNEYMGGGISPGIQMRYRSLNSYTSNLPKLTSINEIPVIGDTTENAIHLGVMNGVIFEINGVIDMFKAKNKKLTIVLTGGDTIFLAKNIKSTIFANPNFLLEGLNGILIYNIEV
jgi:type III pantothenate kinase